MYFYERDYRKHECVFLLFLMLRLCTLNKDDILIHFII